MTKTKRSSDSISQIGIIGLGSIGMRHMRLIKELFPKIKIIGIRSCKDKKKPEILDYQVNSISRALEIGIDACIISTPAITHLKDAKELLSNGVHVLIEKPISNTLSGIDEIVSMINEKNITALVGYNLRYNESASYLKDLLERDILGNLIHVNSVASSFLPDWRPNQDYLQSVSASKELGGGVLLELSHEFDYLRWFFGDIESIYCQESKLKILDLNVEESVDMILMSVSGLQATLHLDFNQKKPRRFCEIYGTNGSLKWNAIDNSVTFIDNNGDEKKESFNTDRDHMYRNQITHFLECISEDKSPKVTIYDGIEALKIALAAKESINSNKRIHIQ